MVDNKMNNIINKLPEDIRFTIYKEHFEPEYINEFIVKALDTLDSCSLNTKDIRPLIPIILSKKYLVSYLLSNNLTFKKIYNSHKINGKKYFELMNNGDSFALSWLMYLYH